MGSDEPPSAAKLKLIRRFMRASGLQARLDSGSFLERYALNPALNWNEGRTNINLLEAWTGPIETLKTVYLEKYRPLYQEAYEQHLVCEFSEQELQEIVAFLEAPVGQHYLEGTWRMEAYTHTNMEEDEEALVREALNAYRSQRS
jgi:hypothetical protein